MIELINDLPDNIIAFTASGRVTSDDYRTVVAPASITKRAHYDTLRLLYHISPAFKKFTTTALWDDRHIGLYRLQDFERVAVVTDIGWIQSLAGGAHQSESTEIRVFANAAIDGARTWICS